MTSRQEALSSLTRLFVEQTKTFKQVERAIERLEKCLIFDRDDIQGCLVQLDIAMLAHRTAIGIPKANKKRI